MKRPLDENSANNPSNSSFSSGNSSAIAQQEDSDADSNDSFKTSSTDRHVGYLTRLLEASSSGCTAALLINGKLLIADNEIYEAPDQGAVDSGSTKKLNLIQKVLDYFQAVAIGRDDIQREEIFKLICVPRLKGEEKGYIKLSDEDMTKIALDALKNYDHWQKRLAEILEGKEYLESAKPYVSAAYTFASLLVRDFVKLENLIETQPENELVKALTAGALNTQNPTELNTVPQVFSPTIVSFKGALAEADRDLIKNTETNGYAVLAIGSKQAKGGSHSGTTRIHAEMTIITYLLFSDILTKLDKPLYIGISKLCCPKCASEVQRFNDYIHTDDSLIKVAKNVKIFIRGGHGIIKEKSKKETGERVDDVDWQSPIFFIESQNRWFEYDPTIKKITYHDTLPVPAPTSAAVPTATATTTTSNTTPTATTTTTTSNTAPTATTTTTTSNTTPTATTTTTTSNTTPTATTTTTITNNTVSYFYLKSELVNGIAATEAPPIQILSKEEKQTTKGKMMYERTPPTSQDEEDEKHSKLKDVPTEDLLDVVRERMVGLPNEIMNKFNDVAQAFRSQFAGVKQKKNAFNNWNDPEYQYEAEDIRKIGSHIFSEQQDKVIFIGPVGKGIKVNALETLKSNMDALGKKKIVGIFNVGDNHWVPFMLVLQEKALICYYKDSLGKEREDIEALINKAYLAHPLSATPNSGSRTELYFAPHKKKEQQAQYKVHGSICALSNAYNLSLLTNQELEDFTDQQFFLEDAKDDIEYKATIVNTRTAFAGDYISYTYDQLKQEKQTALVREQVKQAHNEEKNLIYNYLISQNINPIVEIITYPSYPMLYYYSIIIYKHEENSAASCLKEFIHFEFVNTQYVTNETDGELICYYIDPNYLKDNSQTQEASSLISNLKEEAELAALNHPTNPPPVTVTQKELLNQLQKKRQEIDPAVFGKCSNEAQQCLGETVEVLQNQGLELDMASQNINNTQANPGSNTSIRPIQGTGQYTGLLSKQASSKSPDNTGASPGPPGSI